MTFDNTTVLRSSFPRIFASVATVWNTQPLTFRAQLKSQFFRNTLSESSDWVRLSYNFLISFPCIFFAACFKTIIEYLLVKTFFFSCCFSCHPPISNSAAGNWTLFSLFSFMLFLKVLIYLLAWTCGDYHSWEDKHFFKMWDGRERTEELFFLFFFFSYFLVFPLFSTIIFFNLAKLVNLILIHLHLKISDVFYHFYFIYLFLLISTLMGRYRQVMVLFCLDFSLTHLRF